MFRSSDVPLVKKELTYGRNHDSIPHLPLVQWKEEVVSAYTGPNCGMTQLDLQSESFSSSSVGGVDDWNTPSEYAYGLSLSLYEEDRKREKINLINDIPQRQPYIVGDPIADVFAVVVRENNAILAVADGVSWGKKPRLSARCAVQSAVTTITENMHKLKSNPSSTILSKLLLESIHNAHHSIMQHHATLTTLSVAVVCELKQSKNSSSTEEWGLFVASVGDSPICVYCPHTQQVIEATIGCHPEDGDRNVHISGGALGPAIGSLPDLDNLTLAYMPVHPDDIVLLMSDGISDNLSPHYVQSFESNDPRHSQSSNPESNNSTDESPNSSQKNPSLRHEQCPDLTIYDSPHCTPKHSRSPDSGVEILMDLDSPNSSPFNSQDSIDGGNGPVIGDTSHIRTMMHVENRVSRPKFERQGSSLEIKTCCENIPVMSSLLRKHHNLMLHHMTAQTVAAYLMNFVVELTNYKRLFRADCIEQGIDIKRKSKGDPEFAAFVKQMPGKLDHATIVTYKVGRH